MASGTPRTSRFGMQLVNSEPGPMLTMSASENCVQRLGQWADVGGTRRRLAMPPELAVMLVSPRTCLPLRIKASSCKLLLVRMDRFHRGFLEWRS